MKKLLISGLTIATLMGSFATSASAGYSITPNFYGSGYTITGTGSDWGSPTISCSANFYGGGYSCQ